VLIRTLDVLFRDPEDSLRASDPKSVPGCLGARYGAVPCNGTGWLRVVPEVPPTRDRVSKGEDHVHALAGREDGWQRGVHGR
jgi:hypothetical protein